MKKIALSVIVVLSLIASTLSFLIPARVYACPRREPATLLGLYQKSDTIHVGQFRGQEEGEPKKDEEDGDHSVAEIKKYFDISSTLKGKPVKALTLFDERYIYDESEPEEFTGYETIEEAEAANRPPEAEAEDESEPEEEIEIEIDEEDPSALKPGDHVLLFLRPDEDNNNRPELAEYFDGIKKLSPADIMVYEARIKELNSIFAKEKPSSEAIVDWLVRCAEDKVTRWEGTYELNRSFRALEFKAQRAAQRNAKIDAGETVEDEEEYLSDRLDSGWTPLFAKLLNEHQKQTLANIIRNAEFHVTAKGTASPFVAGDRELLELVARWANWQIASLLMERLRGGGYEPYQNYHMMETVAEILKDDRLADIAGKFSRIAYHEGDEEVDEEDVKNALTNKETDETVKELKTQPEAELQTNSQTHPETEKPAATNAETSKEPEKKEVKGPDAEKEPKMNYKRLRAELTDKFLARADNIVADPQGYLAEKAKAMPPK